MIDRIKAPFIIADIGSNWKRYDNETKNLDCALLQIREAGNCGVDAVKFQLFTHQSLYGVPGESPWALPPQWLPELAKAAREKNLGFLCTAFSPEEVAVVDPYVGFHKVASAEMLHLGILDAILASDKPMILSTGGHTAGEVMWILNELRDTVPVSILQCVAAYPAHACDYNLNFLAFLHKEGICVGVSDHTLTNSVAIVAVGAGATIFEKHFDCMKDLPVHVPTPDSPHSIGAKAMWNDYVGPIRYAHEMMGDGKKAPTLSERMMVQQHNRRLIATRDIPRGETFEEGFNYGFYRARVLDVGGIPPSNSSDFNEKVCVREIRAGESLRYTDIWGGKP